MKTLFTVLVLALSGLAFASSPLAERVETSWRKHRPEPQAGLAIAVVQDGKLVFSGGFGLRDQAANRPITARTRFLVGSTTKAFTALALKQVEARGLLNMAEPVQRLLPGFGVRDREVSAQANLYDLLSHRVGLPRHDSLWYLSGMGRAELVSRIACLPLARKNPPAFRRGYVYNNLLYTAAGMALEAATGQSYESFLQAHIFDAVGMPDTGFAPAPDFTTDFARPYAGQRLLPYKDHTNIAPAGGIVSTVEDLAQWVLTHLAAGTTPRGRELLSPEDMRSLYAPHSHPKPGQTYGLGWFVEQFQGSTLIFHPGSADGYRAYVSFMPEKNLGVVAISNQHLTKLPDLVAADVYAHILGTEVPPLDPVMLETQLGPAEDSALEGGAQALAPTGSFEHCGYGRMSITREGDESVLIYGPNRWPLHRIPFYGYLFKLEAYGKTHWVPFRVFDRSGGFKLPLEPTAAPIGFAPAP